MFGSYNLLQTCDELEVRRLLWGAASAASANSTNNLNSSGSGNNAVNNSGLSPAPTTTTKSSGSSLGQGHGQAANMNRHHGGSGSNSTSTHRSSSHSSQQQQLLNNQVLQQSQSLMGASSRDSHQSRHQERQSHQPQYIATNVSPAQAQPAHAHTNQANTYPFGFTQAQTLSFVPQHLFQPAQQINPYNTENKQIQQLQNNLFTLHPSSVIRVPQATVATQDQGQQRVAGRQQMPSMPNIFTGQIYSPELQNTVASRNFSEMQEPAAGQRDEMSEEEDEHEESEDAGSEWEAEEEDDASNEEAERQMMVGDVSGPYHCGFCPKRYRKKENYLKHLKQTHNRPSSTVAKVRGSSGSSRRKSYTSLLPRSQQQQQQQQQQQNHSSSEERQPAPEDDEPDAAFVAASFIDNNYRCNKCTKKFKTERNFRRHLLLHRQAAQQQQHIHNSQVELERAITAITPITTTYHVAGTSSHAGHGHAHGHLNLLAAASAQPPPPALHLFKCPSCSVFCEDLDKLKAHQMTEHKASVCTDCSELVPESEMTQHKKKHLVEPMKWKCPKCTADSFDVYREFKVHLQTHLAEPYKEPSQDFLTRKVPAYVEPPPEPPAPPAAATPGPSSAKERVMPSRAAARGGSIASETKLKNEWWESNLNKTQHQQASRLSKMKVVTTPLPKPARGTKRPSSSKAGADEDFTDDVIEFIDLADDDDEPGPSSSTSSKSTTTILKVIPPRAPKPKLIKIKIKEPQPPKPPKEPKSRKRSSKGSSGGSEKKRSRSSGSSVKISPKSWYTDTDPTFSPSKKKSSGSASGSSASTREPRIRTRKSRYSKTPSMDIGEEVDAAVAEITGDFQHQSSPAGSTGARLEANLDADGDVEMDTERAEAYSLEEPDDRVSDADGDDDYMDEDQIEEVTLEEEEEARRRAWARGGREEGEEIRQIIYPVIKGDDDDKEEEYEEYVSGDGDDENAFGEEQSEPICEVVTKNLCLLCSDSFVKNSDLTSHILAVHCTSIPQVRLVALEQDSGLWEFMDVVEEDC